MASLSATASGQTIIGRGSTSANRLIETTRKVTDAQILDAIRPDADGRCKIQSKISEMLGIRQQALSERIRKMTALLGLQTNAATAAPQTGPYITALRNYLAKHPDTKQVVEQIERNRRDSQASALARSDQLRATQHETQPTSPLDFSSRIG